MNKNRIFSFYNSQSPSCFSATIREKAEQANLKIVQSDNEFSLRIDVHHGGQVYYKASISASENGGSLIKGEIITIPWNESKSRTKFQKAMEVFAYILGGIVLLPVIILMFLFLGFYELYLIFKNGDRREMARDEKNLLDFMLNKLCCTQIMR